MRLSVGEIGSLTGVSARTLHYYDEIGLLKPSEIAESGYRYYDGEAMARLEQILFYRELDFSLADIARILSAPDYDRREAMKQHRALLVMKRDRLDGLIRLTEETLEEGATNMKAFDKTGIEQAQAKYAQEAQQKYGKTDAYKESAVKTKGYTDKDWAAAQAEMDDILKAFAARLDSDPAGEAVQALVKRWQDHITARYYKCTDEILAGLGELYVADARFTENMDRFGDGTAQLMADAIRAYTKKPR